MPTTLWSVHMRKYRSTPPSVGLMGLDRQAEQPPQRIAEEAEPGEEAHHPEQAPDHEADVALVGLRDKVEGAGDVVADHRGADQEAQHPRISATSRS